MSVRQGFEEELFALKNLVLEMGTRAGNALHESMEALVTQDIDRALKVIDKDYRINRIDQEINEKVIWLIAKQQPVASDLRRIISSIKISTDLERIGDLAVNVAKSTIRIGEKELFKPLYDIPLMAEKAASMLNQVMLAYDVQDEDKARETAELDNEIDEMYGRLIQELLEYIAKNPEVTSQVAQLSFICRDLERVGDHVTNISENIVFMVKGQLYDLNS
ncbi:phosphate signaling complex protein PhoU [Peribacillus loiseleuriae]|uniref:Phosphate-specific transport system accessory protein PhoU n=1 Tax=Peribacillus loiseleuriae TaxID=1679170 RepID=A0A0K9GQM6_9BACI|nr:phosphate signaling complex protein PhoU [Peribacillus loiseleuriae]KMY48948.1 PhoU family transcriptional regulator [Peribacillus loiseleuriae]